MSDLQCAATFLLVPAGTAADAVGSARAVALHAAPGAADAATELARLLDLPVRDLPAREASPGGIVRALDELADEYRGERVAVVVTAEVLTALRRVVLPGEGAVVVEVDADGHRWAPWPEVRPATGR